MSEALETRFGDYGGRFVPEVLMEALDELAAAWVEARDDADFKAELSRLLRDFVGRPTPLYRADRLPDDRALDLCDRRGWQPAARCGADQTSFRQSGMERH